jgi:hypothetical protein
MNRKNLTAAVLAGLAGAVGIVGSAQAVNINPDGLGQVLIYPYYTVNGGNITVLSVVNTSEDAKAVKVRFTEGQNTREVLDFNLYLSAFDVWAAAITNSGGTPTLKTTDTTCTVPYIYGNGGSQEFLPYALTDGGSTEISRATEGHFEMIEMGTVIGDSAIAATHVEAQACTDGACPAMPADCASLVTAWTDPDDTVAGDEGYWLMNPFTDLTAPSGGLFGGASIVNVQNGTMFSYDAKAINGFATTVDANDVLHQEPGNVLPGLNSGDVVDGNVFLDNGTIMSSTGLTRGVDAVSFVFQHDQIMNEYSTQTSIAGNTEWVITFPTKHFYVYPPSSGSAVPLIPFTSLWDSAAAADAACEVVLLDTLWDREEQSFVPSVVPGEPIPPIVSPAPPVIPGEVVPIIPFELCYETSVIRFGAPQASVPEVDPTTEILGSSNFHTIDNTELGFDKGWARLQLDDYPHDADGNGALDPTELALSRYPLGTDGTAQGLEGLPVTGFAVQRFANGFLGDGADVLANYGGIFQHKGTRKLGSAVAPTAMP